MKKTIYYCDRCGKELIGECARIIPHYFDFESEGLAGIIDIPDNLTHFCLDCTMAIIDGLIHGSRETANVSGRVTEQAKKPAKKRVVLDVGKVMALHNAGWPNKEIAAEMHVTEKRIYQCIYRQTRKSRDPAGSDPEGGEHEEL